VAAIASVATAASRRIGRPGAGRPCDPSRAAATRAPQVAYRASGILRERAGEDAVPGRRQVGLKLLQPRRRLVQVREHDRELAVSLVGPLAGQALEEDAAERVDIRATVDRPAPNLLGGDVVDRADEASVARQAADRRDVPREPEVADVGALLARCARHEDVAGLHVSVHEAGGVGRVERVGGLPHDPQRVLGVELPFPAKQVAQVGAVDIGHREVEHACFLSCGERPHHVRMVEHRGQVRLAQEPLPEPIVVRELRREQLQRHPLSGRIFGQIDGAHRAPREQSADTESGDDAAGLNLGAHRPTLTKPLPYLNTPSRGDWASELPGRFSAMKQHNESPKELLLEADRGESESTPFTALTGVTVIVGVAVLAVIVVVIAAIFIAS
jgi:hypothetical protein